MTDSLTIPISVAVSIATGAVSVGLVYGMVKSKIASLEKALEDAKNSVAALAQSLRIEEQERHKFELEQERVKTRIAVMERDGDERATAIDKLEATVVRETRDQNKILQAVQAQLARTRTVSQEMRAPPISRQDPPTDPPLLPPMRRRLPSQRGNE